MSFTIKNLTKIDLNYTILNSNGIYVDVLNVPFERLLPLPKNESINISMCLYN